MHLSFQNVYLDAVKCCKKFKFKVSKRLMIVSQEPASVIRNKDNSSVVHKWQQVITLPKSYTATTLQLGRCCSRTELVTYIKHQYKNHPHYSRSVSPCLVYITSCCSLGDKSMFHCLNQSREPGSLQPGHDERYVQTQHTSSAILRFLHPEQRIWHKLQTRKYKVT